MTVIRERQTQSSTGERALLMLELATRITRTLDLQEVLDESFAPCGSSSSSTVAPSN
jgi:hypothetical protein